MADQYVEEEVAQLRGRVKALTVIVILFMIALGGLAGAVLMQVRKQAPAPTQLELLGQGSSVGLDGAQVTLRSDKGTSAKLMQFGDLGYSLVLNGPAGGGDPDDSSFTPSSLQIATRAGTILASPEQGISLQRKDQGVIRLTFVGDEPALVLEKGGKETALTASQLDKLLAPPPTPPPVAPEPEPAAEPPPRKGARARPAGKPAAKPAAKPAGQPAEPAPTPEPTPP